VEVKLRLQRFGCKKKPFYRIVAASKAEKRDGRFLEIVGLYHPIMSKEQETRLEKEKIVTWLNKGAKPTDVVKNILSKAGIWKDYQVEKEKIKAEKIKNKKTKSKKS